MNFEIKIINNFFDISDFNLVNKVKLDEVESNKLKVYHNVIDKKNVVQQSCIDENLIEFIPDFSPESAPEFEITDRAVIITEMVRKASVAI